MKKSNIQFQRNPSSLKEILKSKFRDTITGNLPVNNIAETVQSTT